MLDLFIKIQKFYFMLPNCVAFFIYILQFNFNSIRFSFINIHRKRIEPWSCINNSHVRTTHMCERERERERERKEVVGEKRVKQIMYVTHALAVCIYNIRNMFSSLLCYHSSLSLMHMHECVEHT